MFIRNMYNLVILFHVKAYKNNHFYRFVPTYVFQCSSVTYTPLKGKLHLPSVNCPLKFVPLGPPKHLDSLAVLAHPKSLVIIRPIVALLHLTKKLVVRYSTEGRQNII